MHKPNVRYLYVETGGGKTRTAIKRFADKLNKDETDQSIFDYIYLTNRDLKWSNRYQAHPYIIIDDFRSYHRQGNNILRLLDRYPYSMEGKGSTSQMVAEDIIITSCYEHITVFRDKDDKELSQILRRIDEIYLVKKEGEWIKKTKKIKATLDIRD